MKFDNAVDSNFEIERIKNIWVYRKFSGLFHRFSTGFCGVRFKTLLEQPSKLLEIAVSERSLAAESTQMSGRQPRNLPRPQYCAVPPQHTNTQVKLKTHKQIKLVTEFVFNLTMNLTMCVVEVRHSTVLGPRQVARQVARLLSRHLSRLRC